MTVARVSGFILGTSESSGVSINNNTTSTSAEADLLGNNTSEGWMHLFLYYTSTAAAGSIDISIFYAQDTGQEATDQSPLVASIVPINGSQKIYLGRFPVSRYMKAQATNNATGVTLTNVSIGYDLYKES